MALLHLKRVHILPGGYGIERGDLGLVDGGKGHIDGGIGVPLRLLGLGLQSIELAVGLPLRERLFQKGFLLGLPLLHPLAGLLHSGSLFIHPSPQLVGLRLQDIHGLTRRRLDFVLYGLHSVFELVQAVSEGITELVYALTHDIAPCSQRGTSPLLHPSRLRPLRTLTPP